MGCLGLLRGRCCHTVLQGERRLKAVFGLLARSTVAKSHHSHLGLVPARLVIQFTDVAQPLTAAPHTVLSAEGDLAVGLGGGRVAAAILELALHFLRHLLKVLNVTLIGRVSGRPGNVRLRCFLM